MTLKEYRAAHGLTQLALAIRAGVRPETIARVERGEGCTLRTAQRIIAACYDNIRYEDLLPMVTTIDGH